MTGQTSHCLTDLDPLFVKPGVFDFDRLSRVKIGDWEYLRPNFTVQSPDHRLQDGSPAIDQGTAQDAPKTDIRGHKRPCGEGVDIGAQEHGLCSPEFIRGDTDGSGDLTPTDVIIYLYFQFLGSASPPCMDAADVDDSGVLDITDAIYALQYNFRTIY